MALLLLLATTSSQRPCQRAVSAAEGPGTWKRRPDCGRRMADAAPADTSEPASQAAAAEAPSDAGASAMQALQDLMDEAEALEQAGKYREAAEVVASGLSKAHAAYVASKVPGVALVRQPTMAMPRHSYVERYKARLRVDWQKWDRCSRMSRAMPPGGSSSYGT